MTKRTYDDKLHIDMPFGEALERFVGVKPDEMHDNIAKSKKKAPPGSAPTRGGKSALPGGQGGQDPSSVNVVSLRDRRTRKRNNNT
jgi:hypothetical protein